jgi:hypothetical protein
MITTNETTTVAPPVVHVRRIERSQITTWLGLAGPLAVAAPLNFWNLTQNGYANLFYSVAVKSMLQSFHNFFFASYEMVLAPGAAALVGIGAGALWTAYRKGGWLSPLLLVALLVTAIWQLNVMADYPQWAVWLTPLTLGGSILAAVPLVVTRLLNAPGAAGAARRLAPGLVGVGLVTLLVTPLAWSLTPVLAAPSNGRRPELASALCRPAGACSGADCGV